MKKIIIAFSILHVILSTQAFAQKECNPLNFNETNIGILHNDYVSDAYSKVDLSDKGKAREQFVNYFVSIQFDARPMGISNEDFFSIVKNNNEELSAADYDFRKLNNPSISKNVRSLMIRILNFSDTITNLDEYNSNLDVIQKEANGVLNCEDLNTITGAIIIAKNSASLWAPKEIGGQGLYDAKIVADLNNLKYSDYAFENLKGGPNANQVIMLRWWQRALIGDVSGAAQYFTGIGIAGAAGLGVPGANGVILGGAAIATGLGSACAALGF